MLQFNKPGSFSEGVITCALDILMGYLHGSCQVPLTLPSRQHLAHCTWLFPPDTLNSYLILMLKHKNSNGTKAPWACEGVEDKCLISHPQMLCWKGCQPTAALHRLEFNSFWFCYASCFFPCHPWPLRTHMTQLLLQLKARPQDKNVGRWLKLCSLVTFVLTNSFLLGCVLFFQVIFSACHVNKCLNWAGPACRKACWASQNFPLGLSLQSCGGWD